MPLSLRTVDYVVLIVTDLDRAVRFYTEAIGLPVKHRAPAFAQLDTGTTRLGLFTREAMAETLGRPLRPPAPDAPGAEIGFYVEDLDGAFVALVAAGAVAVTPPTARPWGQRTAYVQDPDGHLIELVER